MQPFMNPILAMLAQQIGASRGVPIPVPGNQFDPYGGGQGGAPMRSGDTSYVPGPIGYAGRAPVAYDDQNSPVPTGYDPARGYGPTQGAAATPAGPAPRDPREQAAIDSIRNLYGPPTSRMPAPRPSPPSGPVDLGPYPAMVGRALEPPPEREAMMTGRPVEEIRAERAARDRRIDQTSRADPEVTGTAPLTPPDTGAGSGSSPGGAQAATLDDVASGAVDRPRLGPTDLQTANVDLPSLIGGRAPVAGTAPLQPPGSAPPSPNGEAPSGRRPVVGARATGQTVAAPVDQPSGDVLTPPALSLPTESGFAQRQKDALAGQPKAPEQEIDSSTQRGYSALLKAGLAAMEAGGKPGATALGALGVGGQAGIESYEKNTREANALRRQGFQDAMTARTAATQEASAGTQAEQGQGRLNVEQARLVQDAKVANAKIGFDYKQLGATMLDHGLNRDNAIAVAQLNRDSAERVAEAQRGSTESLHILQTQANRDAQLTKQIDDTIAKGKTGPGGLKESYTADEEAKIRDRVILDSPGTTLNEQTRVTQATQKFQQISQAAQGRQDKDAIMAKANEAFAAEMAAIKRDRLGLRK